jgi:hypothetical protein
MLIEAHSGDVTLGYSFEQTLAWLKKHGPQQLETSRGTSFRAEASTATRGNHAGEAVIVFRQGRPEFARAYACCWGSYYNCNRTRIGMYCAALDEAVGGSR